MKTRMKWLGIGLASLLIISLCFSLIHAQGNTNQANLISLQHQVPWFSFLLFLINASMVEEFLYREILWNLVRKLDIRVALTSVLFALVHHPGTILAWCLYVSLGMFLGKVCYKSDLWGSMGIADNNSDIERSQKKIEELHTLIDTKNKDNKKLQSIYDAISELH